MYLFRKLKIKKNTFVGKCYLNTTLKPPWNVLFFGSDDFSLPSLQKLNSECLSNLEVVTGNQPNPIRKYALKENLKIYNWPYQIHDKQEYHLGVVVSFGHLIPEKIINMFPLGMLNVHASLLPRWRGAAPIIHAIANGDKTTGVTIMKIKPHKFDVGDIVMQSKINLEDDATLPEVYTKLSEIGAGCLLSCIQTLPDCLSIARKQPADDVTLAPRVNAAMANVSWHKMTAEEIYNLSRALYGLYHLTTTWNNTKIKLINISKSKNVSQTIIPGKVHFNKEENKLNVHCKDGYCISVEKIGVSNKKPMTAKDFHNGYIKKQKIEDVIFK